MIDTWTDTPGSPYRESLEQMKSAIKVVLARDFRASLMNNTKWRELLVRLDQLQVGYWIKFVDVAAPMTGYLEHRTDDFYDSDWGPLPILSVEWIEVRPVQEAVLALVEQLGVPFERMTDGVRVTAHLRNGEPMPANNSTRPTPPRGAD